MLERVKGIEPSFQAWEAHVLPLNHTRNFQAEETDTTEQSTDKNKFGIN